MNRENQTVSLSEAKKYIDMLNLDYIVELMCSSIYTLPRWTIADAKHCCQLYKNYLYLQKIHINEALVPTREIDEFWHNHILHTQQYVKDCMHIFGRYFHHVPAAPNEDLTTLKTAYQATKDYYFLEYKQDLTLIRPK